MSSDTWDEFAADWDNEPDVRTYANNAFESMQRSVFPLIENLSAFKVLDFGCGTGLLTEKIAPLCQHIVAVDTSARMIGVLKSKIEESGIKNLTTIVTSIDSDSTAVNSDVLSEFDLVIASSVCSFLADFEQTMCDITQTMKPGGLFIHWDWINDMPIGRVENAFTAAGLSVLEIGKTFAMDGKQGPMSVLMGIGRLPG